MEGIGDDEEEEEEEAQQQPQDETIESPDLRSVNQPTNVEQSQATSLIQSLLIEQTKGTAAKKKKKKIKTGRQKELERLTKATKTIFSSPEQLNIACERIHVLLSKHKTTLLTVCRSYDNLRTGRLPSEQFRLITRDRLPKLSSEDLFLLMKLFEIDGFIDYRMVYDEKLSAGILRYVVPLPGPQSNEIVLEKKQPKGSRQTGNESLKYVTLHLRLITFDSYTTYPGHIHLTVPDHLSIYGLSKMIIDQTDLAARSVDIFREKVPSRTTLLDPMRSLEDYHYTGAYVDGRHDQSFPIHTLYYDYSSEDVAGDCPVLKCDYYMKL